MKALACCLGSLVLVALPVAAQSQPSTATTVRGLVRKHLPDGLLTVSALARISLASGTRKFTAYTGRDGFYYFSNVPFGAYNLSAEDSGNRVSYRVEVNRRYTDIPPIFIPSVIRDPKAAYVHARRAFDQGDWTGAAHLFERILAVQPEDHETIQETIVTAGAWPENYRPRYYLGLALFKLGDCQGALAQFAATERLGRLDRSQKREISRARTSCRSS